MLRDEADLVVLLHDFTPNLTKNMLISMKKAGDGLVQNVTTEESSHQFSLEMVTLDVSHGTQLHPTKRHCVAISTWSHSNLTSSNTKMCVRRTWFTIVKYDATFGPSGLKIASPNHIF